MAAAGFQAQTEKPLPLVLRPNKKIIGTGFETNREKLYHRF
jgi:hypothetical protein